MATNPEAAPAGAQTFKLVDASMQSGAGCGCGGHEAVPASSGCGCGGHEAPETAPASSSCGCGGHGGGHRHHHGHEHRGGAGVVHQGNDDELVIHSIPRVVRHAVLFAAVDSLPVGENIRICAPHQPEPLFAHLRDSSSHYRVETLEAGPSWRYRVTRLA
ncbi:DUF2249 domain-containing protein [Schaalia georgiae]|nr:DUF2249 domain-containing protein [Schaalia georgiae]